jgi:hypothetical protein
VEPFVLLAGIIGFIGGAIGFIDGHHWCYWWASLALLMVQ